MSVNEIIKQCRRIYGGTIFGNVLKLCDEIERLTRERDVYRQLAISECVRATAYNRREAEAMIAEAAAELLSDYEPEAGGEG